MHDYACMSVYRLCHNTLCPTCHLYSCASMNLFWVSRANTHPPTWLRGLTLSSLPLLFVDVNPSGSCCALRLFSCLPSLFGQAWVPQRPRPRRNRKSEAMRSMVRENVVRPSNFIYPLFIHEEVRDGYRTTTADSIA